MGHSSGSLGGTVMKKASIETIVRTIVLVFALLNQVLTMCGVNPLPFAQEDVYAAATAVLTVAASLWAWWKNNSLTGAAIEADRVKDALKAGELHPQDVERLMNGEGDISWK